MKDTGKQELLAALDRAERQGRKFADVHQELIDAGYTEEELAHVAYSARYDGKPNASQETSDDKDGVDAKAAQRLGEAAHEDAKHRERQQLVAHGLASRFAPGTRNRAHYGFLIAESAGVPYFRALLIGLVLMVGVFKYNLPVWLLYGYIALIALVIAKRSAHLFKRKK